MSEATWAQAMFRGDYRFCRRTTRFRNRLVLPSLQGQRFYFRMARHNLGLAGEGITDLWKELFINMKHLIIAILLGFPGFFMVYTTNRQRTARTICKNLESDNLFFPMELKNALTSTCDEWNLAFLILVLSIFPLGLYFSTWYYCFAFVFFTFYIPVPLFRVVLPQPGLTFSSRDQAVLVKRAGCL